MRTRIIVAFAALMAASALVAVPEPAASRPSSAAGTIDPATLSAVSIGLSRSEEPAAAIPSTDPASGPAARLGPGSAYAEADAPYPEGGPVTEAGSIDAPPSRPRVRLPAARPRVLLKNPWRVDPEISWYGPGFYGSGTACGQEYTREILGVAHRSLPCGTLVAFRNPANGRQITVPVIDRGPYVAGRTWDMSRALCEYLDHCYTGPIQWRWGGR